MRIFILLIFGLLLAACTGSNNNYNTSINTWRGSNAKDLLAAWGKPFETIKNPGGSATYIYKRQNASVVTATYSPSVGVVSRTNGTPVITGMPNANSPMMRSAATYCLIEFTANASGKIVNTAMHGNNCNLNNINTATLQNPEG